MQCAGRTGLPRAFRERNDVRRGAAGTPHRSKTTSRHDALSMERPCRGVLGAWCRALGTDKRRHVSCGARRSVPSHNARDVMSGAERTAWRKSKERTGWAPGSELAERAERCEAGERNETGYLVPGNYPDFIKGWY